MQVLNIFSDGQNCQNQIFKWLYQLNKSRYEKSFFGKIFPVMLFHVYQIFSSLSRHLHFSLHFAPLLWNNFFLNHPISGILSFCLPHLIRSFIFIWLAKLRTLRGKKLRSVCLQISDFEYFFSLFVKRGIVRYADPVILRQSL